MNEDVEPGTQEQPAQEKPKRARRPRQAKAEGVATQEPTFEQRLAQTRAAAKQLALEKKTRIPLRLGVALELHETLVAIGKQIGDKVPDVAVQAMELGVQTWMARSRPASPRREREPVEEQPSHEPEGPTAEIIAARATAARELHLPGRRRAAS